MFNNSSANVKSGATDESIATKLFSKTGVVVLYFAIVALFLTLQLLGVYLFTPLVFSEQPLTSAQRFSMGSFDGTVTSYSMIFTLFAMLMIIYGIVKWRISKTKGLIEIAALDQDDKDPMALDQTALDSTSIDNTVIKNEAINHQGDDHKPTHVPYSVADYLGFKSFPLYVGMGFVGLWVLFIIATEVLSFVLDKDPTAFVEALYDSANPKWLLILVMVVIAPIYEEVMFRGILWSAVKEQFVGKKGVWVASIITSILFSIIHLQYELYEMSVIFILAMLLSYARAKSGSLLLPIMLHIVNNGVAMWLYLMIT